MRNGLLIVILMALSGCSIHPKVSNCADGKCGEEGSKQQPLLPALNSIQSPGLVEGLDGPRRVQEEQVRVWIAPFQDDQGNLHESSVIYTVVRPGYWQLSDLMKG